MWQEAQVSPAQSQRPNGVAPINNRVSNRSNHRAHQESSISGGWGLCFKAWVCVQRHGPVFQGMGPVFEGMGPVCEGMGPVFQGMGLCLKAWACV